MGSWDAFIKTVAKQITLGEEYVKHLNVIIADVAKAGDREAVVEFRRMRQEAETGLKRLGVRKRLISQGFWGFESEINGEINAEMLRRD